MAPSGAVRASRWVCKHHMCTRSLNENFNTLCSVVHTVHVDAQCEPARDPPDALSPPTSRSCAYTQVWYCSVDCQKAHWKEEGGHKKQCKALQQAGGDATSPTPVVTTARSCDGGACIICLAPDPQPIQSGCACRGDAGLAHIKCRAEAAAYRMTTAYDGWWACGTCQQPFTGVMHWGWQRNGGRGCIVCPKITSSGWLLP
jgi:hypothetical protein